MAQNDWKIGLLGGLDGTKSRSQLNSDIKGLARNLEKLKIYAELAPDQAKQLRQQMKTLQIELNNVTVSDAAINGLINSINSKLKGIQIPNITIGGTGNNTLSRQLGDNTAKLNAFKDSLKNIGMADNDIDRVAKRIERLGVQINSLGQSTLFKSGASGNREFLNVEIDGIDKFGQAVKLTEQWDLELGTLVKSIDAVSTAQEKASSRVDNFASKQKNAVASFQNTINQVLANALDSNSSKPITSDNSFKLLEGQIDKVELAMTELKSATAATFDDAKIKVQEEISNLKILEKQLKNADNIPTKLKGTNVDAGFDIAFNDLEKFKADAKDYPQIISTIEALDKALEGVGDAASLNKFNDQLKVAKSELAKLKSETMSANRAEKVGINVSGLQSKITDLQKISPEIDNFEAEINGAKVTVKSLTDELSKVNTQSDFSVVNTKWRAFTEAAKASGIAVRLMGDNSESSAHKIQKISDALGEGTYTAKVESIVAKTQQWVNANGEAQISTTNLRTALQNLNEAYNKYNAEGGQTEANQKALIAAEEALDTAIKKTNNDITIRNTQFAKSDAVDSLRQKYQDFYDKNTAAHAKWGAQLKAAMAELAVGAEVPIERANQLEKELYDVSNAARQAGKLGLSFFDKLKQGMAQFTMWTSATYIVMRAIRVGKDMVKNVKEIDTAMTSLYKVTDETSSRYNKFLDSASDKAKELGRSVSSLVEQTAEWAKRGYSLGEAEELAKTSSIYANVGEVDDETAVSDITTAMKAFNIEANESITIVDKLNNLGNKYATSSADLGEGLTKSASALKLAGNDINQSLAMITGGTEITQNASEMGNAIKVMSMRIRGMKGELEALGEESEGIESISKIQTQILNQTQGAVNIFKDNGDFKSTYEIIEGIAKVYDKLSQTDQAALLETIAGKQRGNQIAALIQSFQSGQAQKAYADAIESSGSAMREQERWLESLEAKTQQFESAWQSLSNTFLDSGLLKGLVDLGTIGVKALEGLVDTFGSLGTVGIGAGLFAGIKNIGICV